jgi:hypothetical protein
MNRIVTAKRLFRTIQDEIDKALQGDMELRTLTLLKLRSINEELSDAFIELVKRDYEQPRKTTGSLQKS